MAATYNDALPTDKDKVRSDLGGGITILPASSPLLTDEHINAVLLMEGSRQSAVAYLARELVVRFAGKPVSIKAGDVTVDYSARLPAWRELASRLADATSSVSGGTMSVSNCVVW